ncbi:hypothetical protein AB0J83_01490 [Actinoplanes sp. NPDC049596]|uniref:hypothetical protein n=1 Tax=unclassified Actinoplanes TaxID=2626549 RepID=UPI00342B5D2C
MLAMVLPGVRPGSVGFLLRILAALKAVVLISALTAPRPGYDPSAARYGLLGQLTRWVRHPWSSSRSA